MSANACPAVPDIAFDAARWERHRRTWDSFWAGSLERPIVVMPTIRWHVKDGIQQWTHLTGVSDSAERIAERVHAHLGDKDYHGDAWPNQIPNFGPGIVAGFLGGEVGAGHGTTWFAPGAYAGRNLADWKLAIDPANPWWQRVNAVTDAMIARIGGIATVGTTDLGGNLDIIASLRTSEQLLLDCADCMDDVLARATELTPLWLDCYRHITTRILTAGKGTSTWAPIWSPTTCYMLQSDFAYMISPRMFKRYVLQDITDCCATMDHGFYHLDGKGQLPHLDMLLGIERLRGIQWIPGDGQPPADSWTEVLRRIIAAGKRCQIYCDLEGARRIVREQNGGRGFVLALGGDEITHESAPAIYRELTGVDDPAG